MLLLLVTIQAVTGLFIGDDIFWFGPYNPAVSGDTAGTLAQIHHLNFTALQVFVGLHLVAIAWYFLRKRENLILPMLTGWAERDDEGVAPWGNYLFKAAIIAALCAMAIYGLIYFAPEPEIMGF